MRGDCTAAITRRRLCWHRDGKIRTGKRRERFRLRLRLATEPGPSIGAAEMMTPAKSCGNWIRTWSDSRGQEDPGGRRLHALQEIRARPGRIVELVKSNVLLIGSTGTGKTLLCETLSRILGAPFVTADATRWRRPNSSTTKSRPSCTVARQGRRRRRPGAARARLHRQVDKLKAVSDRRARHPGRACSTRCSRSWKVPGAPARREYIDTTHILFICGGAFVGIEEILKNSQSYGYCRSPTRTTRRSSTGSAHGSSHGSARLGLVPEFAGRLPVIARLQDSARK